MPGCATGFGKVKMTTGALVMTALLCVTLAKGKMQLHNNSCKYWTQYNATTNRCECGEDIDKIVLCQKINESLSVSVFHGYCMTLNSKTKKQL